MRQKSGYFILWIGLLLLIAGCSSTASNNEPATEDHKLGLIKRLDVLMDNRQPEMILDLERHMSDMLEYCDVSHRIQLRDPTLFKSGPSLEEARSFQADAIMTLRFTESYQDSTSWDVELLELEQGNQVWQDTMSVKIGKNGGVMLLMVSLGHDGFIQIPVKQKEPLLQP